MSISVKKRVKLISLFFYPISIFVLFINIFNSRPSNSMRHLFSTRIVPPVIRVFILFPCTIKSFFINLSSVLWEIIFYSLWEGSSSLIIHTDTISKYLYHFIYSLYEKFKKYLYFLNFTFIRIKNNYKETY